MEPTKRTISEILFEDEDMPFDSDDDIITECSQDFLEASPFFENLPSQFGNGMEKMADSLDTYSTPVIPDEVSPSQGSSTSFRTVHS
ncbi:hypothetical protein NPIL_523621 [Nephila pilipes]|uniref:Uncharacterized protein n=1 Tax=Nephila pilipes TaxID=299642 RepID=A0A8X6PIV4_NEPPI|nr:hypothetical protein NPIL_523621 [Nephila pilipes]